MTDYRLFPNFGRLQAASEESDRDLMEPTIKLKFTFFGSVNAMPMEVALDLRTLGHEVTYYVDADPSEMLHRPEYHYTQIEYPYPDWIRELKKPYLLSQLTWFGKFRQVFTPRIFYRHLIKDANLSDVCVLNSYGVDLAPFIRNDTIKVLLSSGSDFDEAVHPINVRESLGLLVQPVLSKRSGPGSLHGFRMRFRRRAMGNGDIYSYFVPGLNPEVDKLIRLSSKESSKRLNRLPNFRLLALETDRWEGQDGEPAEELNPDTPNSKSLRLLVPVRFFENPPPSKSHERKGVFDIIRGIGIFYEKWPDLDLQVSIFEKGVGSDVARARELIKKHNLEKIVNWLPVVAADCLPEIFLRNDVVFDQVGNHWPGSIGYTALALGRPVICNSRRLEYQPFLDEELPFIDAKSAGEVAHALEYLLSPAIRRDVSHKGVDFIRRQSLSETFAEQLVALIKSEMMT